MWLPHITRNSYLQGKVQGGGEMPGPMAVKTSRNLTGSQLSHLD